MTFPYQTAVKSFAIALSVLLAGCAADRNPISVLLGPEPAETPDFVQQSRPASLDYIPIGRVAPERPTSARTAAEVRQAEAELERLRVRNEAARHGAMAADSSSDPLEQSRVRNEAARRAALRARSRAP